MPSPPRAGNEGTLSCSTVFRNSTSASTPLQGRCLCWRCDAAAHKHYKKKQEYQDLHNSSAAVMLREMQREVNTGRPFERRLRVDSYTNNHFSQLRSASDLDCCFMAILSWGKPLGPRIMRKLWSNTRERRQGNEQDACSTSQGEDSSYPKGIEVLLMGTARKGYPDTENVDNPKIALQDYDARQSGRVLELQNRGLWIRPTDLSWHFTILVTIREMPFTNYRGRSLAMLEGQRRGQEAED